MECTGSDVKIEFVKRAIAPNTTPARKYTLSFGQYQP